MKLSAITGRGVKKDYVDLYFIFKQFSLADILDFMRRKFTHVNYSQTLLLRALNYFADADTSPMPDMLIPVSWEEVKAEIQAKVLSYTREQLG
jgi:hypothetical protein